MSQRITILGCGSSGGVPRVGSGWGACDPSNPKNRRRRCSILVERMGPAGKTTVLVDLSPDLRDQLLTQNVTRLDGVLVTHEHADHTHGIDDLRPLAIHMRKRLPVYLDERTSIALHGRFDYCFQTPPGSSYPPIIDEQRIKIGQDVVIDGPGGTIVATPFDMVHGDINALGFRFGRIAYASDVSRMLPESVALLRGLDVLILDALRYAPHPSHFNLADALEFIAEVSPRRAVLTNLHTDLDYNNLKQELSDHIEPAFDGMTIDGNV